MPRTHKNLYPEIISFENLLLAARKASAGKRYRESALAFNVDLERNLFQIQEELVSQTYAPGPYKDFIVADSKRRLISAAPFRDRVVHHAGMNVIEPRIDPSFITDSYACRKGKGTHAALRRFREWLPRYRYVLKCDIRRYFPSIDHDILLEALGRRIGDARALWLLERIVASKDFNELFPAAYFIGDDLLTPHERRRGIPVGNLTSQFFANLYLDRFDHWLKEDLRVGPYLRYVDDFCLFSDDKSRLNELCDMIREGLAKLRLRLHEGKSRVYTIKEGVEFLGFRHLPGQVRVRKENTKRFRARMRGLQRGYARGEVTPDQVQASIVSWVAHATYAHSYQLRRVLIPSYVFKR